MIKIIVQYFPKLDHFCIIFTIFLAHILFVLLFILYIFLNKLFLKIKCFKK